MRTGVLVAVAMVWGACSAGGGAEPPMDLGPPQAQCFRWELTYAGPPEGTVLVRVRTEGLAGAGLELLAHYPAAPTVSEDLFVCTDPGSLQRALVTAWLDLDGDQLAACPARTGPPAAVRQPQPGDPRAALTVDLPERGDTTLRGEIR